MNIVRVLEACDRRAESQYRWNDFAPVGLLVHRDGAVEAVAGYALGTSVNVAADALLRAARNSRKPVALLGMVCSAWASVDAVEAMADPAKTDDRRRARLVAAVDRTYLLHLLSNIQGSVSYTTDPSPYGGIGPVLTGAMHRLTEAEPGTRRAGSRRRST